MHQNARLFIVPMFLLVLVACTGLRSSENITPTASSPNSASPTLSLSTISPIVTTTTVATVAQSPLLATATPQTLSTISPIVTTTTVATVAQPPLLATTTPQKPQLGEAPQNCPLSDLIPTEIPNFTAAIGRSPIWNVSMIGRRITINIGNPPGDLTGSGYTEQGWQFKLLWVVERSYTKPITITGANLADNTPLWFDFQGQDVSTTPILDARKPPRPPQYPEWIEFSSYVLIPQAGCYYIEAVWPEGSWKVTFAAGI